MKSDEESNPNNISQDNLLPKSILKNKESTEAARIKSKQKKVGFEKITEDNSIFSLGNTPLFSRFLNQYYKKLRDKQVLGQKLTSYEILCIPENTDARKLKDHYKFLSNVLKATGGYDKLLIEVKTAYEELSKSIGQSKPSSDELQVPAQDNKDFALISKDVDLYKQIIAERTKFSKLKRMLMGEYLSKHELKALKALKKGKISQGQYDIGIINAKDAIYYAKKTIKARSR